jgi:hypothetical protein
MAVDIGSRGSPRRGSDIILWRSNSGAKQQWNDDFTTKMLWCHQFQLLIDVGGGKSGAEAGICA